MEALESKGFGTRNEAFGTRKHSWEALGIGGRHSESNHGHSKCLRTCT